MPLAKKAPAKAPIRNKAVTGKPLTPSGSGTVHPGRAGPRSSPTKSNGSNDRTTKSTATKSTAKSTTRTRSK